MELSISSEASSSAASSRLSSSEEEGAKEENAMELLSLILNEEEGKDFIYKMILGMPDMFVKMIENSPEGSALKKEIQRLDKMKRDVFGGILVKLAETVGDWLKSEPLPSRRFENEIAVTPSQPVSVEFNLGTFNVARHWYCDDPTKLRHFNKLVADWSDERLGAFHWNKRAPRIADAILSNDLDFVGLVELNTVSTSSMSTLLAHPKIEARYCFVEWIGNGNPLNPTIGLLYDRHKWFLDINEFFWLGESFTRPSSFNLEQSARICGCATFYPIDQETLQIQWVEEPLGINVTHLAYSSDATQHKQVEALCSNPDENSILMGDFTFYNQRGEEIMRETMEKTYANLGKGAIYSQSKTEAKRTLVPYSFEPYFEQMKNTNSITGHIFAKTDGHIEQIGEAWLDTKTYLPSEPEELSDWDALPSSHMPLCVRVKVTFDPVSEE